VAVEDGPSRPGMASPGSTSAADIEEEWKKVPVDSP
jgi:hypothetical protein